jgi:mono/diheme cytochrome c family protein
MAIVGRRYAGMRQGETTNETDNRQQKSYPWGRLHCEVVYTGAGNPPTRASNTGGVFCAFLCFTGRDIFVRVSVEVHEDVGGAVKKIIFALVGCILLLAPLVTGQKPKSHGPSAATLARGKYLVDDVGLCGDCHTPHNDKGEPIKEKYLQGAPLDFKPSVPMPVWAEQASNIAGLPGWDRDAAIKFMMTGLAQNGLPSRPPMPQFRFNVQDAQAIVVYLKSLLPAKGK